MLVEPWPSSCWLLSASMMGPSPLSPITITSGKSHENHMLVILPPPSPSDNSLIRAANERTAHRTLPPSSPELSLFNRLENNVKDKHRRLPMLGKAQALMGKDAPTNFRACSVEFFDKDTFIGVGQAHSISSKLFLHQFKYGCH